MSMEVPPGLKLARARPLRLFESTSQEGHGETPLPYKAYSSDVEQQASDRYLH